ncbi:MAG: glycosyltransferase family 4 protein [Candidatus Thorarchaeota archaeon]|jgi:glycosyltransferase involved in cell wall biosynthesis
MKILHLCDSLNPAGLGGYESIIHYLSKAMVSEGHESFVVTQPPYRNSPESIQKQNYIIYHLTGNLLEARKWEYYALPETEREKAVEKLFKSSDIIENVDILTDQFVELIHELKPDIIHAHSTYVVFNKVIAKLCLLDKLKIPAIVTVHGLPKPLILPNGKETTDYDEFASDFGFDLVITVSENVAEAVKKYLDSDFHEQVRTLYSGIDLTVFRPLPDLEKEWDLAFMGRLEAMKSVDLFPEMLALLKSKFPDLKMMMTGEGSLKDRLFKEFEEKGVSSMVDYQGVVETDDVPVLINKSRIFLYPSRREPFGLSIVEAMACGVPVITTDVFGPREIVRHNYDGVAVPPDDVVALAKAVGMLLTDNELRTRIGQNALKSAQERYDISHHAKRLIVIYDEMISMKRK